MISIIVAIAEKMAIGKNNDLLWHLPEDLKRFKKLTTGHTVIMGENTFESLPIKPLPNRSNIIISHIEGKKFEGCLTVYSIESALENCPDNEECFVIGGASVYKQFLEHSDKLYITRINKEIEGDTFFPKFESDKWELIESEKGITDEKNQFDYNYEIYRKY